ncbi:MAG: DUF3788 domain-containing protein [Saprospiraceae bacterium]|nr:DUF3788 domain-containing protein [Saprospiraceae bacterium]
MDTSIFPEKEKQPEEKDLIKALGKCYDLWHDIVNLVYEKYPKAVSEWNYPGQKYGWSFRVKDKKRAIIYLLPRDQYFMVAFNFGQKAVEKIMESNVSEEIKHNLATARVYAEGRGIRIEVKNLKVLEDISQLIEFKLAH